MDVFLPEMPEEMLARLREQAAQQGRSLNDEILAILERHLSHEPQEPTPTGERRERS